MTWLIPGVIAAGLAFSTSFITIGPPPSGPVKACTQIAVTVNNTLSVSDCEGPR